MATWSNIRDCAQSDIGCLEHLMDEVQQGRMNLSLPPNLPIPHRPWRNIRPMRSNYVYPFKFSGQDNASSEGSDIAASPMEGITGDSLSAAVITDSISPAAVGSRIFGLSPPGLPDDLPPLEDNIGEEYHPSPVSSTGLDWEVSEDASDHESSVDFVMSEHSNEESLSNSESE
jgi:hypothetical protein